MKQDNENSWTQAGQEEYVSNMLRNIQVYSIVRNMEKQIESMEKKFSYITLCLLFLDIVVIIAINHVNGLLALDAIGLLLLDIILVVAINSKIRKDKAEE